MMTAASGGALVAGGASAPSAPDDARIRVLRSFIWAREPVPVGREMQLARRVARELALAGKVEILPDATPAEPEAPPADPAPAEPGQAELLAKPDPAAPRRQQKDPPA
jgi:hypothetical protein